jgi:hypothetical protein
MFLGACPRRGLRRVVGPGLLSLFATACTPAETQPTVTIAATATAAPAASTTHVAAAAVTMPPPPPSNGPKSIPGTTIRFKGGDGSTMHAAIVIMGAKGEQDGTAAEYKYLDLLLPDTSHTVRSQALLEDGGRSFDRLDVQLAGGKSMTVFFDITDYFGKF